MGNIFISYNRRSEDITKTLINDIEAIGHTAWYDQELSGGQSWWDQILARVRDCDVFVFVLEPAALNSTACKREYGYAADLGKPILPILVSDGVSANLLPPVLSRIQFVDYRRPDRQAALRLARAFTAVPPATPLPHPLPIPPKVPTSYLGGLTEQVETTSVLSFEQQSALVVDLRRSLRDPETTDDARALLERLRKRHDLFATIAEEIDELVVSPRQAPSVPPRASVPEPSPKVDTPQHTDTSSSPAATDRMTLRERLLGAFVGAGTGAVWGAIAASSSSPADRRELPVIVGIAGAITGAISGTHGKVIVTALAGFGLGFVVWALASDPLKAVVLGGPIGAILGAIVGAIWKKLKERT